MVLVVLPRNINTGGSVEILGPIPLLSSLDTMNSPLGGAFDGIPFGSHPHERRVRGSPVQGCVSSPRKN